MIAVLQRRYILLAADIVPEAASVRQERKGTLNLAACMFHGRLCALKRNLCYSSDDHHQIALIVCRSSCTRDWYG